MRHKAVAFWLPGCVLAAVIVSGCATTRGGGTSPYVADRTGDYPVKTIAATFAPAFDHEIRISGKADGALGGAGRGVLECTPALAGGIFGAMVFVPCAALTGLVGGAIGAYEAAPKAETDSFRQAHVEHQADDTQNLLAEKTAAYLSALSELQISDAGPGLTGPGSATDRPVYPPHPGATGTLLEVSLLSIRYTGSGKDGAPVCLQMAARGRKIDAATGEVIDELEHQSTVDCHPVDTWLSEGGIRFHAALDNGFQGVAEYLVDRLYLTYRSPRRLSETGDTLRPVPEYVLAPIVPRAPEVYLDLKSITRNPKHLPGWGGMHFVDVDSLSPEFRWEVFPRSFDLQVGSYTDISYDLRIYTSRVRDGAAYVAEPATEWLQVNGLGEPAYALASPLQPCSHYFWTVRARFTLDGTPRVTEWAGAYYTAGGEVAPERKYFYPFRTPAADGGAGCWS